MTRVDVTRQRAPSTDRQIEPRIEPPPRPHHAKKKSTYGADQSSLEVVRPNFFQLVDRWSPGRERGSLLPPPAATFSGPRARAVLAARILASASGEDAAGAGPRRARHRGGGSRGRRERLGDGRQGVRGVPVRHAHGALSRSVSSPRPRRAVGAPSTGSNARSARGDGDLTHLAPPRPPPSPAKGARFSNAPIRRVLTRAPHPPYTPPRSAPSLSFISAARNTPVTSPRRRLYPPSPSPPRRTPSWTRSARTSWTAACSRSSSSRACRTRVRNTWRSYPTARA